MMEGVTVEIRNKIKCAVKAKLQEIGAYVDEELPDYIMVMIANRRSKSQMTSELSLFLGGHTDKFTDWLHVVLEKLEAYVISTNSSYKKGENSSSTTKNASESFVFSLNNIPDTNSAATYPVNAGLAEAMDGTHPTTQDSNLNHSVSTDQYVPLPISATMANNKNILPPPEDMEEDCLNIREEVEPDFHADDKTSKQKTSSSTHRSSTSDHKRRHHNRSADSRDAKRFRREDNSRSRRGEARLSSQIVSVVGTIMSRVQKPVERSRPKPDVDRDNSDRTLSKNGVNSIVRVTARRKLPAKMQATNSLILKAVAEAQKSVITCPPKAPEPEAKPIPELFTRRYREKHPEIETVAVTIANPALNHERDATDVRHLLRNRNSPVKKEPLVEGAETKVALPVEEAAEPMEYSSSSIPSPVQSNQIVQTRFIVTLDGARPEITRCYDETSNDYDDVEIADLPDAEHIPVKSRLFRRRSTGTEAEVQQTLERCKFWPNCRQGDRCNFHHPKTMCKNFPSCTFGENCLFIHPQCKFDSSCTRKSCPYTHSGRTKAVAVVAPTVAPVKLHPQSLVPVVNGKTVCKFFPACNNVNCLFFHPPACKFGTNCTRSGCTFSHPTGIPPVNKLKWVTSTK